MYFGRLGINRTPALSYQPDNERFIHYLIANRTGSIIFEWQRILTCRGPMLVRKAIVVSYGSVHVVAPVRPIGMSKLPQYGMGLDWRGEIGSKPIEAIVTITNRLS